MLLILKRHPRSLADDDDNDVRGPHSLIVQANLQILKSKKVYVSALQKTREKLREKVFFRILVDVVEPDFVNI